MDDKTVFGMFGVLNSTSQYYASFTFHILHLLCLRKICFKGMCVWFYHISVSQMFFTNLRSSLQVNNHKSVTILSPTVMNQSYILRKFVSKCSMNGYITHLPSLPSQRVMNQCVLCTSHIKSPP